MEKIPEVFSMVEEEGWGKGIGSCSASHLTVTVCSLLPRMSQVQLAGELRLSRPTGLCKVPCTSKSTAGGSSQAGEREEGRDIG